MSKLFQQVEFAKTGKSLIDLSHEKKLTMNMGQLVPIMVQEVLPGDKFQCSTEHLIRFAPLVSPVMHRINVYVHHWFVPERLVHAEWEKFITGGKDGKETATRPFIRITAGNESQIAPGSLADYMGIPTIPSTSTISYNNDILASPFRAYQLIYNNFYRDENLIDEVPVLKTSGIVADLEKNNLLTLRKRAWEKDYFTSALPWSQKGDEIELPNNIEYKPVTDTTNIVDLNHQGVTGSLTAQAGQLQAGSGVASQVENIKSIGITINDLRRSARLQEFLEKSARGGNRLTEFIKSFFGVESSDARLQLPEFLGGGKQPVSVSEVLSTFNNETVPGAQMYGHGISVGASNQFRRRFEEHGWIISILSILPRTAYQQGIPKMYRRFDKYDLYWPTFAQLGEQEVKNWEIYHDWAGADLDTGTFGYQSRYAEYKFQQSTVHGDFKDSLKFWHMGRIFDTKPALNETFVNSDPTQRIFAVTDPSVHKLYVQLYHNLKAIRPMPYFNKPIL
ncbi:MAG: major capsid protein [Microviridae sp.]|nr:MAG: major capsid protein [Microviridae sp.]